jgi:hypothetical protein
MLVQSDTLPPLGLVEVMVRVPSELVVIWNPPVAGNVTPSVSVEVQVLGFAAIVMEAIVPPPFSVTVAELNKLTGGFGLAESL